MAGIGRTIRSARRKPVSDEAEKKEDAHPDKPAGAGARVLRELLRTPALRQIVKLNLEGMDPENARNLVRALVWEDVNFSLDLLAESPKLVNCLAEAVCELGRQVATIPPPLRDAFLSQAIEKIDTDRLAEIPRVYRPLFEDALKTRDSGVAAAAIGRAISSGARIVNRSRAQNPRFWKELAANLDALEVLKAAGSFTWALALRLASQMWQRVAGVFRARKS